MTLVHDIEQAVDVLNRVKELGVEVAIDDFGTGHSSLNYLKCFPVDRPKIDKSFVDKVTSGDKQDMAIIKAIMEMANSFGLSTIAEGIEHASQAEILHANGCRGQGYHFEATVRGRFRKPADVRER